MNCKQIQELILTDYLDGEATTAVQERVKAHIASCAKCRAFEQVVRENGSGVFRNIDPVRPAEEVWHRIQEALHKEQPQERLSYLERMFDFLRESFIVRRPAYALATAGTVMLVVAAFWGTPFRRQILVKDYLSQKTAFMLALNRSNNGEIDTVTDFNTAIEEYLF